MKSLFSDELNARNENFKKAISELESEHKDQITQLKRELKYQYIIAYNPARIVFDKDSDIRPALKSLIQDRFNECFED